MTEQNIKINTTLTCPECETRQKVIMPENQYQHYYKCTNEDCLENLSPVEGDDCVFCSFADIVCPQRQINPKGDQKELQSLI
jgi:hypothetical protein